MKKSTQKILLTILYPIVSILVMVLVWRVIFLKVGSEFIFPSLIGTLGQMGVLLGSGEFWLALLSTLGRVVVCFAISLVLALFFGVLGYFVKPVQRVLSPIVAIFRSAPTVAMMVILTLVTTSYVAPVIVGLLVVFPMLYANVNSALNQVDAQHIQMCKLYDVPKYQQFKYVYLPTVLPYLLGEIPATLSFTVKLIVSAEILSYTAQSLGGLIQSSAVYVEMAKLFALTILSVLFATLLDATFTLVAKFVGEKSDD